MLVVEDDQDLAAVLADFMRELGYHPLTESTADEAVRRLAREPADAIVLDLRLPGMSGLDFLRLPLVRDSGIPVVVISGVATEEEAREALRLGAFLRKPVILERLGSVLGWLESSAPRTGAEWRRVPRARVALPVRVDADWEWRALDLSPFGVKIAPQLWLRAGATVRLLLALPDGEPPREAKAVLVRNEPDGDVFSFIGLGVAAFQRLGNFVRRVGPREGEAGSE